MKNLSMVSAEFQTENPAKFLFLALDAAKAKEEIKNDAENSEKLTENEITTRYNLLNDSLKDIQKNFAGNPQALAKFEESVMASLSTTVSADFPLLNLSKFDIDAETGLDYGEFENYTKYLAKSLAGISSMPELNSNYKTPDEKRQAYELLSEYSNKSGYENVAKLVEAGMEIKTIEARIKIKKALSGDSLNSLKNSLDGSWYSLDYGEETIAQAEKIVARIFDKDFKNGSIDTDFEGWDGPGDPNYSQLGKIHMTETQFLQRLLTHNLSGSELSQAFSTQPPISKQKSKLEKQIQISNMSDENRKKLGIILKPEDKLSGESLKYAQEKLNRLEKAERLEKFLDSLEKSSGLKLNYFWSGETGAFNEIQAIRGQLQNAGDDPQSLTSAMTEISRVLKTMSDYFETNDNFWDIGWISDGVKLAINPAATLIEMNLEKNGILGGFGQSGAEWIAKSDTNLGIALRAVKDRHAAAEVMENEMMKLQTISAKKDADRSPAEKLFMKEHDTEVQPLSDIKAKADKYKTSNECQTKSREKYDKLLEGLRGTDGGFPPEYLQILQAGKDNVINGIASRMAFQHSTEEYIETNGATNLAGTAILAQYEDMQGLGGFWNWSDENIDMGRDALKMIVVIILTTIATAGASAVLAAASANVAAAEAAATAALAVEGLAEMEGGATVIAAINGIKGIKNAETIAAALEGINGATEAKNAVTVAANTAKVVKASRLGNAGYRITRNLNKINKFNKWGNDILKINPNNKTSLMKKVLKRAGRFGTNVLKGSVEFTAGEAALFGVDSPDEFLAKFGQNVEMFALFGAAGKIAGGITGKLGRTALTEGGFKTINVGGKEVISSLATKGGTKAWLAQQGIALTSELGVFATFQAIETGLYREDISEFSWKELAHLMTFSMIMRLAHAGFPRLSAKLMDVKKKGKTMHDKINKGEFDKARRQAQENIKKHEKIIKDGGENISVKNIEKGDVIEYEYSSTPGTPKQKFKMEVLENLGNGKFKMEGFESKTKYPEVKLPETKIVKRIGKNGAENVVEVAQKEMEIQKKIAKDATTEINNIQREQLSKVKSREKTTETKQTLAENQKELTELVKSGKNNDRATKLKDIIHKQANEKLSNKKMTEAEAAEIFEKYGIENPFSKTEAKSREKTISKEIENMINEDKALYKKHIEKFYKNQIKDINGRILSAPEHAIYQNGLNNLTNKKFAHGSSKQDVFASLKVINKLLSGEKFIGDFGPIEGTKFANKNPHSPKAWENGKFIITNDGIRNLNKNGSLNIKSCEIILNGELSFYGERLAKLFPEVTFKDYNGKIIQKSRDIAKTAVKSEVKTALKNNAQDTETVEKILKEKSNLDLKDIAIAAATIGAVYKFFPEKQEKEREVAIDKILDDIFAGNLENSSPTTTNPESKEDFSTNHTLPELNDLGAWDFMLADGAIISFYDDGTISIDSHDDTKDKENISLEIGVPYIFENGASITRNADGSADIIYSDGTTSKILAPTAENPAKKAKTTSKISPKEYVDRNGNKVTVSKDGTTTTVFADGSKEIVYKDGTSKYIESPHKTKNSAKKTSTSPAPKTKPAKYTATDAGTRFARAKTPEQTNSLWDKLIETGGEVETKTTAAGQEYSIWTGADGKKLMKITHSSQRRSKAKRGDEGWILNRKGGVTKGDVRDILGRESVRRRDIKKLSSVHEKDNNGVDTFTRIYEIKK